MKSCNLISKEYIAGFFDGEGCIYFRSTGFLSSGKPTSLQIIAYIGNSQRKPLELIKIFCKENNIKCKLYDDKWTVSKKKFYRIVISQIESLYLFLKIIKNNLIIKRGIAETAYKFLKLRKNHKYYPYTQEEKLLFSTYASQQIL